MSTAREQGRLAYAGRVAFEQNPFVPGGPEVAERCRLHDWPEEAREWHGGWTGEAILRANQAEAEGAGRG